jgi:hypothetical protein
VEELRIVWTNKNLEEKSKKDKVEQKRGVIVLDISPKLDNEYQM